MGHPTSVHRNGRHYSVLGLIALLLALAVSPLQTGAAHADVIGQDANLSPGAVYIIRAPEPNQPGAWRNLDVLGGGRRQGTGVGWYNGNGAANEQWQAVRVGADYMGTIWAFRNIGSGMFLDVANYLATDPSQQWLDQYPHTGAGGAPGPNQRWYARNAGDGTGIVLVSVPDPNQRLNYNSAAGGGNYLGTDPNPADGDPNVIGYNTALHNALLNRNRDAFAAAVGSGYFLKHGWLEFLRR